jgi:hypothetical protein
LTFSQVCSIINVIELVVVSILSQDLSKSLRVSRVHKAKIVLSVGLRPTVMALSGESLEERLCRDALDIWGFLYTFARFVYRFRTPAFHVGKTGSIPVPCTIN